MVIFAQGSVKISWEMFGAVMANPKRGKGEIYAKQT